MSNVLTLAADFIERMANPGYGVRVNEEYALRLGAVLSTEDAESLLRHEIPNIREPDTLSPHAWLWLLNWARAKELRFNEELLLRLVETLSSVFMQVVVIDVATRHDEWEPQKNVVSLKEFGHPWLSQLLHGCTQAQQSPDAKGGHIDTRRPESVLTALMQVGSNIALDAASTLINHNWVGQRRLVEYFWSLHGELDSETQDNWKSRLRPPAQSTDA